MAQKKKTAGSVAVGAAKKVGKKAVKKAVLSAAAPYIAGGLAIVLAIGLFVFIISSSTGAVLGSIDSAASRAAAEGGVKDDDRAVIEPIANSFGIPWYILADLPIAQSASGGAQPGYNGPYAIKEDTDGITNEAAKELVPSTIFIAANLRAQLDARSIGGGVVYHQDSLTVGAGPDITNGGLTYENSSESVRNATALTKKVFVESLVGLPVNNATQTFMAAVFDTAQAWALGKNPTCTGARTNGTSPGVQIALPAGALAGLSEAQTRNAAMVYNAAMTAGMGDKGAQIGVAVALAESTLQNYANDGTSTDMGYFDEGHRQLNDAERAVAKQSLGFPHDTVGHNLDSIGLFQQRPSANWGAPGDLIDPVKSAAIFFDRLKGVAGWDTTTTPWVSGQTVQGSPSSDGGIYQHQYEKAATIVVALQSSGTVKPTGTAAQQVGFTSAVTMPTTAPRGPPSTSAAVTTGAPTTGSGSMPYPLPATRGTTGTEEALDAGGHVPSGRGVGTVTFSKFAALGSAYQNYYITMRWSYAAWNFNGTSSGIDQAQYSWFEKGNNGKPWMVLVTNPRTNKSIIAPVLESGPGPWVGVTSGSATTDPTGVWTNPTRGTPAGYKGLVSGFPPKALQALGAVTGYVGQQGDHLIYQWAPDQNVVPGPSALVAKEDGTTGGTTGGTATGCTPCPPPSTSAPASASTAPVGSSAAASSTAATTGSTAATTGTAPAQPAGTGTAGCSGTGGPGGSVVANGPNITLPNMPDIDESLRGKTIKASSTQVAAGIVWALNNAMGLPYVWGGGGLGSSNPGSPDNGANRGGGDLNSGGSVIGYDCSGISWTLLFHMEPSLSIPDGNSGSMASGGTHIPYAQTMPGDLVTFDGHVAVSLGTVDGNMVILEAPEVGKNVRVVPMFRTDHNIWVSRYWTSAAAA